MAMPGETGSEVKGGAPRGVLPFQGIRGLARSGAISADLPFRPEQFQPASLDLRLSAEAFEMPGSILPMRDETVRALIAAFGARAVDLSKTTEVRPGQVLLVRIEERFLLPAGVAAYTNNKSSIGRIDLQTRTISDKNPRYEKHAAGYHGELWIEVIPKSFTVAIRSGIALDQAIFHGPRETLDARSHLDLLETGRILVDAAGRPIPAAHAALEQGVMMSVDLEGDPAAWVARRTSRVLDLTSDQPADPAAFFDRIPAPGGRRLRLERGRFYILSTLERIRIPTEYAVEMLPYESTAGEFRAHYAGFFDPGFGYGRTGEIDGTPAVLEVRSYDDDILLRHGQPICRMAFERLTEPTESPYGASSGGHYARQSGPRLSRHFAAT